MCQRSSALCEFKQFMRPVSFNSDAHCSTTSRLACRFSMPLIPAGCYKLCWLDSLQVAIQAFLVNKAHDNAVTCK